MRRVRLEDKGRRLAQHGPGPAAGCLDLVARGTGRLDLPYRFPDLDVHQVDGEGDEGRRARHADRLRGGRCRRGRLPLPSEGDPQEAGAPPVSYTHLTLPTIYSV